MSAFAPTTNQIIAVLEREAHAIAEKLGHTWDGIFVMYVDRGDGGPQRKEYWSRCSRCSDVAKITPRAFDVQSLRGEMLTFPCPQPTAKSKGCKHCGGAIIGLNPPLCKNPNIMGPCET